MYHNKIVKIKKDHDGEVEEVLLENGRKLPINHAIMLAKDNLIDGAIVTRGKDGGEYLRIDPNNKPIDNIMDLPTYR